MSVWTKQRTRSIWQPFLLPLFTILFIAYFAVHLFNGDYGLIAEYRVRTQIERIENQINILQNQVDELNHKISLLKDGTIEQDMLDELVRRDNNFSRPDDVIIMMTQGDLAR